MRIAISNRKALYEWKLYLFVVPSLFLVVLFSYWPTISAVYHSFFRWRGGDAKEFVGWGNFREVLGTGSSGLRSGWWPSWSRPIS